MQMEYLLIPFHQATIEKIIFQSYNSKMHHKNVVWNVNGKEIIQLDLDI